MRGAARRQGGPRHDDVVHLAVRVVPPPAGDGPGRGHGGHAAAHPQAVGAHGGDGPRERVLGEGQPRRCAAVPTGWPPRQRVPFFV